MKFDSGAEKIDIIKSVHYVNMPTYRFVQLRTKSYLPMNLDDLFKLHILIGSRNDRKSNNISHILKMIYICYFFPILHWIRETILFEQIQITKHCNSFLYVSSQLFNQFDHHLFHMIHRNVFIANKKYIDRLTLFFHIILK